MTDAPRIDVKPKAFVGRFLPELQARLGPEEGLIWVIGARQCDSQTGEAKLVDGLAGLTTKRLVLLWKGLLSGISSETKLLSDVTTVEFQDRFIALPQIRVAVAGDRVIFLPMTGDRDGAREFAEALRRMSEDAKAKPPAAMAQDSAAERLRELSRLKDEGLITQREFESKRRELLSQL